MMPISHRLLTCAPALVITLLILVSAAPLTLAGIALVPNIVWLATIAFARTPVVPWPAWLVFLLGLLQDIIFGTPLGAQATIGLFLLLAIRALPARVGQPILRDAWVEATILLIGAQLGLALTLEWVMANPPPLAPLMLAAIVNICWFPIISWGANRLAFSLLK